MKLHLPLPRHVETRYIYLDAGRCQACWACLEACPRRVLGKVDLPFHRHAHVDQAEKCKGCLRCARACPQAAIQAKEKPHDLPQ